MCPLEGFEKIGEKCKNRKMQIKKKNKRLRQRERWEEWREK